MAGGGNGKSPLFHRLPDAVIKAMPTLGASATSVMVALCTCYNNTTGQCNPGIETLSERTGLSVNTVRAAIKDLEDRGLIQVTKNWKSSPSFDIPSMRMLQKAFKKAQKKRNGGDLSQFDM